MDYHFKYIKYKTKYLKLSNKYQIGGDGSCLSQNVEPKVCHDFNDYFRQNQIFIEQNNLKCKDDAKRKQNRLNELCISQYENELPNRAKDTKNFFLETKRIIGERTTIEPDNNCKSKNIEPQKCNNKMDYLKQVEIFEKSNNTTCVDEAKDKVKKLNEICKDHRTISFKNTIDIKIIPSESEPESEPESEYEFESVKPVEPVKPAKSESKPEFKPVKSVESETDYKSESDYDPESKSKHIELDDECKAVNDWLNDLGRQPELKEYLFKHRELEEKYGIDQKTFNKCIKKRDIKIPELIKHVKPIKSNCKSENIEPKKCNDKYDYQKQYEIFKKSNNVDCIDEAENKMIKLYEMCKNYKGIIIDTDINEEKPKPVKKDEEYKKTEIKKEFKSKDTKKVDNFFEEIISGVTDEIIENMIKNDKLPKVNLDIVLPVMPVLPGITSYKPAIKYDINELKLNIDVSDQNNS